MNPVYGLVEIDRELRPRALLLEGSGSYKEWIGVLTPILLNQSTDRWKVLITQSADWWIIPKASDILVRQSRTLRTQSTDWWKLIGDYVPESSY